MSFAGAGDLQIRRTIRSGLFLVLPRDSQKSEIEAGEDDEGGHEQLQGLLDFANHEVNVRRLSYASNASQHRPTA